VVTAAALTPIKAGAVRHACKSARRCTTPRRGSASSRCSFVGGWGSCFERMVKRLHDDVQLSADKPVAASARAPEYVVNLSLE
jgi:hypothetical protein